MNGLDWCRTVSRIVNFLPAMLIYLVMFPLSSHKFISNVTVSVDMHPPSLLLLFYDTSQSFHYRKIEKKRQKIHLNVEKNAAIMTISEPCCTETKPAKYPENNSI
jgi:hypothetical protein